MFLELWYFDFEISEKDRS